ncbi:beta-lactamase, partial [Pontibacter sp. HJ8]
MRLAVTLLLFFIALRVSGQTDLEKPFQDCRIQGSITLYDYQAKKWISSNIHDSHVGTLPASTFKILNTLIALETGVIADENEIVKWPGKTDTIKYG